MAISPICNKCGKELKKLGGLIFGPPNKNDVVQKYHICRDCFKKLGKSFFKKKK